MQNNDAQAILTALLADAKAAGAQAADAVLYHSVSHGVSWRMGKLEDVERSEGADLGLRVMVGKRQASVSTTDHSRGSLKELAERCTAMAKAAPEDPYCGLAPAERLAKPPYKDMDLGDFAEPTTEALQARAAECEEAALAVKGVVNSSGADSKTHIGDLKSATEIGRSAGERAVRRLSPRKPKSRTAPVIFDNRLSASLLSHLAGAVNGAAIARGVSFLKNKKGEKIFADNINIIDDPHVARGQGSRPFDGEGVVNARIDLIKNGVLTDWLMNSSQAAQLGLETNGRATRGTGGTPGSGSTNLYLEAGTHSADDLLKQANEGLLLTDMFGPQVNSNTGDYSVGCSGFWVEDGAIAYPVSEITIAGNILEMFAGMVHANDLEFRGSTNAPSILIPAMTIAGD